MSGPLILRGISTDLIERLAGFFEDSKEAERLIMNSIVAGDLVSTEDGQVIAFDDFLREQEERFQKYFRHHKKRQGIHILLSSLGIVSKTRSYTFSGGGVAPSGDWELYFNGYCRRDPAGYVYRPGGRMRHSQ